MTTETILTELEAAEFLRVSPRTLQGWRVRGDGPPFMKLGRAVCYRQADLSAFLATQSRAHTSQSAPRAA